MAEDFRERAKAPFIDPENVRAFERAAEALESRDDGGELSPDDARDRIAMGITHLAKAVGHGLCIKSAGHIARAIDCMSAVIGANGGSAEPIGDEDPNDTMALAVKKLEPKPGDLFVLSGISSEEVDRFRTAWDAQLRDTSCIFLPAGATIDLAIDEKQAALAELDEALTAKQADIERKQVAFDILTAAIAEFAQTAAGAAAAEAILVTDRAAAAETAKTSFDAVTVSATDAQAAAARALAEANAALDAKRTEVESATRELEAVTAGIAEKKQERLGRVSRMDSNDLLKKSTSSTTMKPEHYRASHTDVQEALRRQVAGNAQAPPITGRDSAIAAEK
jgi:uncharacterized coiled-coil protein SlyX